MDGVLKLLVLLSPLIIIELGVRIFALVHCVKHKKPSTAKTIWIIAIVLVSLFGWAAYFMFGRDDE